MKPHLQGGATPRRLISRPERRQVSCEQTPRPRQANVSAIVDDASFLGSIAVCWLAKGRNCAGRNCLVFYCVAILSNCGSFMEVFLWSFDGPLCRLPQIWMFFCYCNHCSDMFLFTALYLRYGHRSFHCPREAVTRKIPFVT